MATIYVFDSAENLVAVLDTDDVEAPIVEAIHLEQINGENSFRFTIPANHPKANFIVEDNLVGFWDLDGDFQLFEIKIIEEMHDDVLLKSVFCEHAAFEMLDDLILFEWPKNQTAGTILALALQNSRWQVGNVTVAGTATVRMEINNPIEVFNKMVEAFGGEFKYRVEVSGNQIVGRFVDFLARRGENTGRRFEYSRDVTSIKREVDITDLKTALYGFGKMEEVPGGRQRLRFSDVEWSVADGDPVDKPLGQEYVVDPVALARFGRDGGSRNRFGFFEDSEEVEPENLLRKTWEALQQVNEPRVTYEMEVMDLAEITGVEAHKVRLGDTVVVIDKEFNPELRVSARVIEYRRNLIEFDKNEVILGNFVRFITDDGKTLREIRNTIENQGVWEDGAYQGNLVNDGAFSNVPTVGSADGLNTLAVDIDQPDVGDPTWWNWRGNNPRVISSLAVGNRRLALFSYQAAVVNGQSNPYQYVILDPEVGIDGPYTVSFYAAAFEGTVVDGTVVADVWAVDMNGNRLELMGTSTIRILQVERYNWKRGQVTVFDLPFGTFYLEIDIRIDTNSPNLSCIVDGVQCVPKDNPSVFLPEKELGRFYAGLAGSSPRDLIVRNSAKIGYNHSISDHNFEFTDDGILITRSNSGFSVGHTPSQSVPASTWTKVNFQGQVFEDWHNEFDNVNSEFIPKKAGVYLMSVAVSLTTIPAEETIALRLVRNGVEDARLYQTTKGAGTSSFAMLQGSVVTFLGAGDVCYVEVFCSGGASTVIGSHQSYWKAFRLGGRR